MKKLLLVLAFFTMPAISNGDTGVTLYDSSTTNYSQIHSPATLQSTYRINLPLTVGTTNQVLAIGGMAGNTMQSIWANPGAGGSPGGSPTQIQFNSSGSFGGIPGTSVSGNSVGFSTITISGLSVSTQAVTGNFTLTSTTTIVYTNCSSACTQTLPSASNVPKEIFTLKSIGAGPMSITAVSGTIDGSSTITPNPNQYATIEVQSDGTNYNIL